MRLIQISDIHFGSEDRSALKLAESYLKTEPYDGLLVCGDLTQRGKKTEFDEAKRWLDQFDVPQLVVAGNHDTPMLNMLERTTQPFVRFDQRFGQASERLTVAELSVFGINTSRGWQTRRNWAEGVVDIDHLQTRLDEASETSLLVCHHPFQSPPGSPLKTSTRNGKKAGACVAASKLNILLSGHVHAPSATIWEHAEGTYLAISCGTMSTRLRQSPPSFNQIDIDKGCLSVTVHDLSPCRVNPRVLGAWNLATLEEVTQ